MEEVKQILIMIWDNWEILTAIIAGIIAIAQKLKAKDYKGALDDVVLTIEEWSKHTQDKTLKKSVSGCKNPVINKTAAELTSKSRQL